jgi:hypothetical protein
MKRTALIAAAAAAALAFAGCGSQAHPTATHTAQTAVTPPQVLRLQGCLGQYGVVDWYNGVPSFEYRHVDVFVYWSVGAAKASLHHDPRNPGLATLIRTKNVVVLIGDAIVGGEEQDAARVHECLQQ